VLCTNSCLGCHCEEETDFHAFVGCEVARESRFSVGLSVVLLPRVSLFQSLPELIFDICCKESDETGDCVAVLLW